MGSEATLLAAARVRQDGTLPTLITTMQASTIPAKLVALRCKPGSGLRKERSG
jgi:hypothetical protein